MSAKRDEQRSIRDGALEIAKAIIDEMGLDGLSLREVARRLGVSHYAPYKHFPSRDHLVAELIRQAFDEFAQALEHGATGADGHDALAGMGRAYVTYALRRPLEYRLMFGTSLPDPATHQGMMQSADAAFSLLERALRNRPGAPQEVRDEALFVWSSLHGLVTILASDVAQAMNIRHTPETASALVLHHLSRIL